MTPDSPPTNRRDALLQILRLGGLSVAAGGAAWWLKSRSRRPEEALAADLKHNFTVAPDPGLPAMVVAQGEGPEVLTRQALKAIGSISRFVKRGDVVVVKPNIAWDRTPEQAANTNPQVVSEIVRLCLEAGAKKVIVTDVSCNDPRRCFERSGIAAAARAAGAEVLLPEERRFKEVDMHGDVLSTWAVLDHFLNADKMINVPIAKHHSLTECTLGMKNWYGILGGPRHRLHQRIQESLVDLADFMRPTLTILDAYRILLRNGPTGGNVGDTALKKTVIASTDPVALDAYVAKAFWDLERDRLPYLKMAQDRGLGKMDFESVRTSIIAAGA
ncbi:MAG: DUF362 domain-containing protein [Acidobacteria bacterium]|nr:DUF362 domain-containing protein [Acidobacteriota bacterium]